MVIGEDVDRRSRPSSRRRHGRRRPARMRPAGAAPGGATRDVPLGTICGARSGDKGGNANVGLWVRTPEAYRWLADS